MKKHCCLINELFIIQFWTTELGYNLNFVSACQLLYNLGHDLKQSFVTMEMTTCEYHQLHNNQDSNFSYYNGRSKYNHSGHNLQHGAFTMEMTTYPPTPVFNNISLIKIIVLSIMFVISLIGNTATLIQMYRMRRRKSTINTLIMHLACADLIVTFFCNVTEVAWQSTIQWLAGNFMCKIVKFMQVFGLYLSTYITVIISLDRCMAILDPMSRNKAPKRVRSMIIVAWVLSALFSSPQVGTFGESFCKCFLFLVTLSGYFFMYVVTCSLIKRHRS